MESISALSNKLGKTTFLYTRLFSMHSKHLQGYLLMDNVQYLGITGGHLDLGLIMRTQRAFVRGKAFHHELSLQ